MAKRALEPYVGRRNLSVTDWERLGRELGTLPDEQKVSVRRHVMGAINRQELVPPQGIAFMDALFAH
jgi:hypothetical protein